MRYFTGDEKFSLIPDLNGALQARNTNWNLEIGPGAKRPHALIRFGDEILGELELNRPGDGLFEEEIGELLEFIEHDSKGDRDRVTKLLQSATAAYVVRVLFQDRDPEDTLGYLDVFWEVLFDRHDGMLQADAEGYYDLSGMILEVK
jgi:hypothetical protein